MLKQNLLNSPLTQMPIRSGALCLASRKDHVKATNTALFSIIGESKKLGNANLWFAAIYLLLKQKNAEHFQTVLPIMERQLIYRCENYTSFISLCGLPTTVTARTKLGAAIWFCYGGALAESRSRFQNEAFRIHLPYLKHLKQLCEIQKFRVSDENEQFLQKNLLLHELVQHSSTRAWKQEKKTILALKQNSIDINN